jgi:membrane fusion protein, multidrug efflux system
MPEIFPAWMTSPFIMYGVPGFLVLIFLFLLVTRNWRGLRRYTIFLVLLGLISYTGFTAYVKYLFKDFQWQMPPATVMVQTVAPLPFSDRIEAVGTTEANESASITANVTETVKSIMFAEGQFVPKGTVIAQLHDDEEQALLTESQKAFNRSDELVKTKALSVARRDADRAKLDVAQAQVRDRQIVAPFDGILGLRSISAGDIVNPGTVITTIDDINPIKLQCSVPESYMSGVANGQAVIGTAEAWPGQKFTGEIIALDPRIDQTTRTLKVKAAIPNPDGKLRAGMLMNVAIVKNERQSLAVSEEAQGPQKLVMVASTPDKDGLAKIEPRPITIGTRMAGYVEVTSGLQADETVVVEGVIKAAPGSTVHVAGHKDIASTIKDAVDVAVPGKQDDMKSMDMPQEEPTPDTAPATDAVPVPESAPVTPTTGE